MGRTEIMKRAGAVLFVLAASFASERGTVLAQGIAVQQPVVRQFGVSTSVSVPDRGGVLLGGIDRAASARSTYGPAWRGSSIGVERSSSSVSAHVFIQDLRAMDEALLREAGYDDRSIIVNQIPSRRTLREVPLASPPFQRADAERFEQLALKAEKAGRNAVAEMHWQMAAKYGSQIAQKRLASDR